MIPAVAVTAGPGAAGPPRPGTTRVEHGDLCVAWSTDCRWVDHSDDGDVLVVVDGLLHGSGSPERQAEIVAARYRATAADVAVGLRGDFVVVILDRAQCRLVVARDPVGVRPWYQSEAGPRYAGATTEAAVAGLAWVDGAIDERSAVEYLATVWESRGRTFHRGVATLAPGHTAVVAGGRVAVSPHHRWALDADSTTTWSEAVERCRHLLDDAVTARVDAAGPATSQLSGGLDSSSVVGTLVRLGRPDVLVGRLAFPDTSADERAWSDVVIDHWRLPAVTATPWVPDPDEAVSLTRSLDRPVPDPHFTMFAGLHRALLERGRADGLTGLGGDDAFATSGPASLVLSALGLRRPAALVHLARRTGWSPGAMWAGLARPALHHAARRPRPAPWWVSEAAAATVDLPARLRTRPEPVTGVEAVDERIDNLSSGYTALVLETQAIVSDLEGRRDSHPFLDPQFIEGTYGLNPFWPTRDGTDRALQLAAYRDRLPPAIVARRTKAEFSSLFWAPHLRPEVLDNVRTGPLADRGWLEPAGFEHLVANATKRMANAAIPLAHCVSLDRWLRSR